MYDKAYKANLDDNQQGRYLWSRQLCNIHFPYTGERKKNKSEGDKKKESPARKELELMLFQLGTKNNKDIMEAYKDFSPKFHFILQKIIASAEEEEGPILVYCEWVWYGILAMTKVLELLGWEFLNSSDYENRSGRKRFGIWSGEALKNMGIKNSYDQDIYTSNLRKILNHPRNQNGKLCKVLFTTVTEGISLNGFSEMHITSPWWNESRMEQEVGRIQRYRSHCKLPENRQFVDIYYHCSVFDTFKSYPKVNNIVASELAKAIYGEDGKIKKINFKDMARLTIEQKVYITARRKNDINAQFELALKETAIDYQLNKYGNLIRFEEIIAPPQLAIWDDNTNVKYTMAEHSKTQNKIFYSRSENKYYYFKTQAKKLYELSMLKISDSETDRYSGMPVWPSQKCVIGEEIIPEDTWDLHEVRKFENFRKEMLVSYIVTENIESFNNNPAVKDKNFHELRSYAIKHGEDPKVWAYFEDQRIRNKMFDILAGLYKIPEGTGSEELLESFYATSLSGDLKSKIVRGTATKDLTEKLYQTSKDPELKTLLNKLPVQKQHIEEAKAKKIEKRLASLFFSTSEDKLKQMKKIIIEKFHKNREWVEARNAAEITTLFYDLTIKERNKSKP